MSFEGLEVELDRLADHRERLLTRITLADAAGQGGDGDAVPALSLRSQQDLEITRRHDLSVKRVGLSQLAPQRKVPAEPEIGGTSGACDAHSTGSNPPTKGATRGRCFMHHRRLTAIFLAAALMTVATSSAVAGSSSAIESRPGLALFEGKLIDLSRGWGDARTCVVFDVDRVAECYRDAATLHARETELTSEVSILASCSTPLRLYANTGFAGQELAIYTRGIWQNLSTWGFDNKLSSYKVGACGSHLAENANGGGSWYPGNTGAGAQSSSMLSGWDNRVSSVYLQ